jgi:alginate O-acetyltransferase complex protein AlgI
MLMLFSTEAYILFFTVVFTAYWAIPWQRLRVWLLLVASFYFYASWNHWLALLIGVSTCVDYVLARCIDGLASKDPNKSRRRWLLGVSIVLNLGLLCYFKYANFFLDSLTAALHALGASSSLPTLSVILPVGISFYTFEAINYTVDVYRGKVRAERNLANFMLFITFFPHLVAGPIVRARDFLPQTRRPKHWDWARLNLGVQYFLMGLFKKLAIADRMASFVDPVFADPGQFRSHTVWMAVLAYALQIYGDFSGYTDMAIGSAHMLGYKLAQNFNMPYLARNISEFWRRWHISLSTWLRDYLFIPLGGSRAGGWLTSRNLLITMTLGGLWHGASWTFVIWGAVHGLLLVGHRLIRVAAERHGGAQSVAKWLRGNREDVLAKGPHFVRREALGDGRLAAQETLAARQGKAVLSVSAERAQPPPRDKMHLREPDNDRFKQEAGSERDGVSCSSTASAPLYVAGQLTTAACILGTFLTICFTWVLFRATSLEQALQVFERLFAFSSAGVSSPVPVFGLIATYLLVALCHWVALRPWWGRLALRLRPPLVGLSYGTVLTMTLILAPANGKAFIYFQF